MCIFNMQSQILQNFGFLNRFCHKLFLHFQYQKPIILKIKQQFLEHVKRRVWYFYLQFALRLNEFNEF